MTRRILVAIPAAVGMAALSTAAVPGTAQASLCVAPAPPPPRERSAPETVCWKDEFFLKIDDREKVQWSTTESVRISGLDSEAKHRVAIYCGTRPQQSFTFRFSEFKSPTPCLFLNDLYVAAQLWDHAPWCTCK
ncbi:MAG: hypothetical protein ACRD1V_08925 [Vicinamibacterales bacterium]